VTAYTMLCNALHHAVKKNKVANVLNVVKLISVP